MRFFRFSRFLLVGLSGLVLNNLLLAILTETLGLHYLLSAALATQGSTLWNFILIETAVFGDRLPRRPRLVRLLGYAAVNNLFLLGRGPVLYGLVAWVGLHYVAANVVTLLLMAVVRYGLSDLWIWAGAGKPAGSEQLDFSYDIHGLVRIASAYRLPELDYFRVPGPLTGVDIRVRKERRRSPREADDTVHYDEGIRRYGFEVSIAYKDRVEVAVSPLLGTSLHVLYTNVVEPILRWTFVRKGYALVHGACMNFGRDAVLLTSQTDTGKTTTVLRTIDSQAWGFLSDDMTILSPDGQTYSYPKPLTISFHTLKAVDTAELTRGERLALQVQSRLHSRSGRLFGQVLARLGLPAATLNTVIQMLIPPPKYPIHRLVPSVRIERSAPLTHAVLIERGPDHEEDMRLDQATDVLVHNAEDAYGFPPYPALAGFLSRWRDVDLHDRERAIIRSALRGCSFTRMRDAQFNWWRRLPPLVSLPARDTKPAAPGVRA